MSVETLNNLQLIKESARDFAEAHIRPHVMEWDEAQTFPVDLFHEMGQYGFLGVLVILPFDVIAWLLIRKRTDGSHRWKWLMVCTLAFPIIMTATWLLMGPAVRKYYRASVNEPIQLACDVCSRIAMSL